MENLVEVKYAQTGQSTATNSLGMREMQQRAYTYRASKYLLLKAPPASGKSRALMFIALDKLYNQGIKKVIVAVPERSIGSSFKKTELKKFGFFADWTPDARYNLCTRGEDNSKGKIAIFKEFMDSDAKVLICTHATLRFAYDEIEETKFNDCLLAIDEFHHVSADLKSSRLGELLHSVMNKSNAHVIAMTGSYFRGDGVAVLRPEDEMKFDRVTYNYYEQLNGYTHLKSLGIGYHFYQGKYLSALPEILDANKKTIIHIPNVNSLASMKDKYDEVDRIIEIIGELDHQDPETNIWYVKRKSDGKVLKIADLVEEKGRDNVVEYLRNIEKVDDLDIIIALGMAKEGFDWPFCEQALTIGYRGSLTEIVQIIGRCTRDSDNKSHAQFTNLIAHPDASDGQVTEAVNNMLKAITCSLLMEQVLAPKFNFKTRVENDNTGNKPSEIKIRGFKQPSTAKVKKIVESDLNDLKATILQDTNVLKALPGNVDPVVVNKVLIPKIIQTKYPDLSDEEVEEVRQYVIADSAIKTGSIEETGDLKFIRMANRFVNIDDLSIDLIDTINPFQKAFEILSKTLDKRTFRLIQECIDSTRIQMTEEEAIVLWPKIKEFVKATGSEPDKNSVDPHERELAQALIYIRNKKRNQ